MSEFSSINPATGEAVWSGRAATGEDVDRAVRAARDAFPIWSSTSIARRVDHLNAFADGLKKRRADLSEVISRETGKPRWESNTEIDSMINKVAISIDAITKRRGDTVSENAATGVTTATRYKPHGVVAVLGPFNFPGHLPNGHIVPALLAGNTVVFKPSELAPGVAQLTFDIWTEAGGLPPGVLSIVQGGKETGAALVNHPDVDGVFFTGSFTVGRAINRALADRPGRIAALEMGGNNPLVVWDVSDLDAAAYWTVQSAFITAGQRCSCARRLIVPDDERGDAILDRLVATTKRIVVGPHTQTPEPFMGPVINDAAADRLLAAQQDLISRGGRALLEMRSVGPRRAMLLPGIIDVTPIGDRANDDCEHFGPLLQLIRVKDFGAAIAEANATRFGLAAGLFSDDRALYERFFARSRAGVVNWNRPLTGASSALPFGGIGDSGNHRPSAYFAADYCSYPVTSMETPKLSLPAQLSPGIQKVEPRMNTDEHG